MYDPTVLCKHSIDELAERGVLKGMDMIIWRLCKHFGFETRTCMRLNFEEVDGHDKIWIRDLPKENHDYPVMWKEEDTNVKVPP